jgi:HlyD family secretion protein
MATSTPAAVAAPPSLFRATALQKLDSPERLDLAVIVVRPVAWMLLLVASLLVVTAVAGSILVRVPVKVSVDGMLLSAEGVREVSAASGGQLIDLQVHLGDVVKEGQVIAHVEQADLKESLIQAVAQLRDDREELDKTTAFQTRVRAAQEISRAEQRRNFDASSALTQQRLTWTRERLRDLDQLAAHGLAPKPTVMQTRTDLIAATEELARTRNARLQLDTEEANARVEQEREGMRLRLKVAAAERAIEQLQEKLTRNGTVTTPYGGVVVEMKVNPGELVERGSPLLALLPDTSDAPAQPGQGRPPVLPLVATLYVPQADGKRIHPGMEVQIVPSTVKREEFGFIVGRVTSVAAVPATQEGMQRALKNRQLVASLSSGGAPFEIRAELLPSASTPTGYQWSSSRGPESALTGGSPCKAEVVTRSEPLLQLAIPALRRLFPADSRS